MSVDIRFWISTASYIANWKTMLSVFVQTGGKRPTIPITDQGNAKGSESKKGRIKGKEKSKEKIRKRVISRKPSNQSKFSLMRMHQI